jgi:hypothetical protein
MVFDGYGNADVVGIAYFVQWSTELAAFDYSELLLNQMENYPHRYVLDFILGTPFLWQSSGANLWVKLLEAASRPDTTRINDQVGAFADIEFLSRYVGVDALAYVWRHIAITAEKRLSISIYFRKYNYSLVPSNLDEDDLDGEYFVAQEVLDSLRNDLCFNFGFERVTFSEESVAEYVSALATK